MKLDTHNGLYWSPQRLLSYNRLINIAMGTRTAGKSFAIKHLILNDWVKNGAQFILLKRKVTECKDPLLRSYFSDLQVEYFPDFDIRVGERFITIDGETAGYIVPLKQPTKIKGQMLSRVKWIVFDEFLTEDNDYLPEEIDNLLSIYQSVARGYVKGRSSVIREDVRIILLANAVSMVNPYMRFLGLYDIKEGITKGEGYAVELFRSEKIAQEIERTQFGKLIKGTRYGNYAVDNSFYLDNNKYIAKPDLSKSRYMLTVKYRDRAMGIYSSGGLLYVCKSVNKSFPYKYIVGDYEDGYTMLQAGSYEVKLLRDYFTHDLMRFADIQCKYDMIEVLNIVIF